MSTPTLPLLDARAQACDLMVRSVSRIREVTAIIETPTGLRIVVDTSDTSVHTRVVNAVPRTWRGNVSVGRRERPGVVLWRRA